MNAAGPFLAAGAFAALWGGFNTLAPVTANMTIKGATYHEGIVEGRVTGRKIKDCAVVKGSFVGWQKVDQTWHETPFQFVADESPDSTRPDGWEKQDFGIWQWSKVLQDASRVKMTLQHNCNGRLTVTQAVFDAPM